MDGNVTFASILEGIDNAREYILFQFFIVHDDEIGERSSRTSSPRRRRGCGSSFLYDEVGSHDLPKSYKDELRDSPVSRSTTSTLRKGPATASSSTSGTTERSWSWTGEKAWVGGPQRRRRVPGEGPKVRALAGHPRADRGPGRPVRPALLRRGLVLGDGAAILEVDWTPRPSEQGDMPILIVPIGPCGRAGDGER